MEKSYIDRLYEMYINGCTIFYKEPLVKEGTFNMFFIIINNVLKKKMNEEDLKIICEHFIKIIIADIRDFKNVDIDWFINHVWYLYVGISNSVKETSYKKYIPYIQEGLVNTFCVQESIKEKFSRKLRTRYMINS